MRPIAQHAGSDQHVVLALIAAEAFEPFEALNRGSSGVLAYRGAATDPAQRADVGPDPATPGLPLPLYEYSWNHTTLHALKVSRGITYHQTLHPAPDPVRSAVALHRRLH